MVFLGAFWGNDSPTIPPRTTPCDAARRRASPRFPPSDDAATGPRIAATALPPCHI
uniref:Transaldolase B n=1 Tax=mine drainage metagenome TaxID=410659 RepID=E6PNI8_9ZZZZ